MIDIKEKNISSFFSSLLQQFFDSKYNRTGNNFNLHRNISWCSEVSSLFTLNQCFYFYHEENILLINHLQIQLKSSGNMDICGFSYVDEKVGWIPRVVWEFSIQSGNKEAQLLSYINNIDSAFQKEYSFFFLGSLCTIFY